MYQISWTFNNFIPENTRNPLWKCWNAILSSKISQKTPNLNTWQHLYTINNQYLETQLWSILILQIVPSEILGRFLLPLQCILIFFYTLLKYPRWNIFILLHFLSSLCSFVSMVFSDKTNFTGICLMGRKLIVTGREMNQRNEPESKIFPFYRMVYVP